MSRSAFRRFADWLASPWAAVLLGEPFFRLSGRRQGKTPMVLSEMQRVLVVRLDRMGDVVLTSPFLRELRRNLPKAWITLIVNPGVYNLVELCPYVNEILTFEWNVQRRLPELQKSGRALRLARQHLWRRRFDLAIVPRWDADYYHATFVAYFSGAFHRVGYSDNVNEHKRQVNGGLDQLLSDALPESTLRHEVGYNLEVIRSLGGTIQEDGLEIWTSPEDEAFADWFIKSRGIQSHEVIIGLGPGAGEANKKWPVSRFIKLSTWLSSHYSCRILVIGGPDEAAMGAELAEQLPGKVINAIGQTTLRQTGALLKRCCLYIGNDSGPMHLAAAVGTPVVEICCHPRNGARMHPRSPGRFGPWGVPNIVVQPEVGQNLCADGCISDQPHCILAIPVERVQEAATRLLCQENGLVNVL